MPEDPPSSPRQFVSHIPAIAAGSCGAVCAALLGSFLGTAGTMLGMAIGSVASGTVAWWAERGFRRANAAAKAQAKAVQHLGRPLHEHETQVIAKVAEQTVNHKFSWKRWRPLAVILVSVLVGCVLVVTLVERAVGEPLTSVVTGHPGHGTTLGGGGTTPASPSPSGTATSDRSEHPSPSATPTGTVTAHSPSPSPSPTSDATAHSTAPGTSPPESSPGPVQSAVSSAVSHAVSPAASQVTSRAP